MTKPVVSTEHTPSRHATLRAFRIYGTSDEVRVLGLIDQTFAGDVSYTVATEPEASDAVFALDPGHFEKLVTVLDEAKIAYKEYSVRPFSDLPIHQQAELRQHRR